MRAEVGRFCSADDNWKMKKNQRRVKKKKKKKKKKKPNTNLSASVLQCAKFKTTLFQLLPQTHQMSTHQISNTNRITKPANPMCATLDPNRLHRLLIRFFSTKTQ
jgi:hypothetical protein